MQKLYPYQIFYSLISAFLVGVFVSGLLFSWQYQKTILFFLAILAGSILILFKKYRFLFLIPGLLLGIFYYSSVSSHREQNLIAPGSYFEGQALVKEVHESDQLQKIILVINDTKGKEQHTIEIKTQPYPQYQPGDIIQLRGKFNDDITKRTEFYLKDDITGTMSYPSIIPTGQKIFTIYRWLDKFKNYLLSAYDTFLPKEQAIFLGGINFGEDDRFSKELRADMKLTGTTHLTALSGYNISLLVAFLIFIFAGTMPLWLQWPLVLFCLIGFGYS